MLCLAHRRYAGNEDAIFTECLAREKPLLYRRQIMGINCLPSATLIVYRKKHVIAPQFMDLLQLAVQESADRRATRRAARRDFGQWFREGPSHPPISLPVAGPYWRLFSGFAQKVLSQIPLQHPVRSIKKGEQGKGRT
jgi:hypothetical protein